MNLALAEDSCTPPGSSTSPRACSNAVLARLGSLLVAGWLGGIVGDMLLIGDCYDDVALRDFALLLSAVTLARLATAFVPAWRSGRRAASVTLS